MLCFNTPRAVCAGLLLLFCCCRMAPRLSAQLDELMLVEYVDWRPGSSYYLKIYNPLDEPVDLTQYCLCQTNNGNADDPTCEAITGEGVAEGMLPGGETYIIGNHNADNISSNCAHDEPNGLIGVNGNDAIVLKKRTGVDCGDDLDGVVDMIGNPASGAFLQVGGEDEGLKWGRLTRRADNCQRYTETDGANFNQTDSSGPASWPNNAADNVTGWLVSEVACLEGGFAFQEFEQINAAAPGLVEICLAQGSVRLAVTPENQGEVESYHWSIEAQPENADAVFSNETARNPLLENLDVPGEYVLEVLVTASNCKRPRLLEVVVVVADKIDLDVTPNPAEMCENATLSLTVETPGFSNYIWTPDADNPIANTPEPGAQANVFSFVRPPAGEYVFVLTGEDAAGCEGEAEVSVTVSEPPNVDAGPDLTVCEGESFELAPSQETQNMDEHFWSDQNNTNFSNEPIPPPLTLNDYPAQLFPDPVQRTYTLNVLHNGCAASDEVAVTLLPLPEVTAVAAPASICAGEETQLTATVNPTTGNTYNWAPVGGLTTPADQATVSAEPTQTATYTVEAEYTFTGPDDEQHICANTATVSILVDPKPVVTASVAANPAVYCVGDQIGLNGVLENEIDFNDLPVIQWSQVSGGAAAINPADVLDASAIADAPGTYEFELVATSAAGCESDAATVAVEVIDALDVQPVGAPPYEVCVNENMQQTLEANLNAPASLSNADLDWNWQTASGTLQQDPLETWKAVYTAPPDAGQYQATLTASLNDNPNCTETLTFDIEVHPLPDVRIDAPQTSVCEDELFDLTAEIANLQGLDPNEDFEYAWTSQNGQLLLPYDEPTAKGSVTLGPDAQGAGQEAFSVTVTNNITGCANTETNNVSVLTKPLVDLTTPDPVCPGEFVATPVIATYKARGTRRDNIQFQWFDPDGQEICPTPGNDDGANQCGEFTGDEPGNYSYRFVATDIRTGCAAPQNINLVVKERPEVRAIAERNAIRLGETTVLTASGAAEYEWTPVGSLADPFLPVTTAAPEATTTYTVTGTEAGVGGCSDTAQVTVEILPFVLNVPTVFSPNGDGINDENRPELLINSVSSYSYKVFNRWGALVFETTSQNEGWDGADASNEPAPEGVYFYHIVIQRRNGEDIEKTGSITLLR